MGDEKVKKLSVSAAIAIVIALVMQTFAFAAAEILEAPDVKIIIDGKLTKYEMAPVSINGNTLLPLREMLTHLGVPNDDEHIIYNSEDKSITVINGDTRIELFIGRQDAYVNGGKISLNVAPVIYEKYSSTYIPLRFAAEALGKKVVWDGTSKSVLICDKEKFDSIRQILDRSNEETEKLESYKLAMDVSAVTKSEYVSTKTSIDAEAAVDRTAKKMSMKMLMSFLGLEFSVDTYYAGNSSYVQEPFTGSWYKQTYPQQEYDRLFENQSNVNAMTNSDVLCTGLNQVTADNENEILLKGDVYLTELFEKAIEQQNEGLNTGIGKMKFDTFSVEIRLDKTTYLVNSIHMNAQMKQAAAGDANQPELMTEVVAGLKYSDYNADFSISVPEDVVKKAVERKAALK